MPSKKRNWTKYPGIYYTEGRGAGGKAEKTYYVVYRRQGKLIEEKAGRERQDDMTPAKAAGIRAKRIEGKELPNAEKRRAEQEAKKRESPWTIIRLWEEYEKTKVKNKSLSTDKYRYKKYIMDTIGNKEPHKVVLLDIDRLQRRDLKGRSPQTVKHVLALLLRIIYFGTQRGICQPLPFNISLPKVSNQKTEDLNHAQLKALIKALDESQDTMTVTIMRMAMYTGMRRGELLRLHWQDIDFERGFITIRQPKGGKDVTIPLNSAAREVLKKHPRTHSQPLIFYRKNGEPFTQITREARRITEAAGIPQDFRPLHGLRHHYASALASSGKVDLYVLQRLLTHKSPQMTQRYSHLRDHALRQASDLAGELFKAVEQETDKEEIAKGGEA
jgi:integrase